jgi:putative ABC transport system permease protein
MDIIKGRNFSKEFGSDSTAMVINETTASLLGYDDPVGKKLYTIDGTINPKSISFTIIGVVKNFHFESLRQTIGPLCMRLGFNKWETAFKTSTQNIKPLLSQIESKWHAMAPGMPFQYRFLDESFNSMYRDEQRIGKLALTFAVLAIFIACLGLFGLATYMAEQRMKEIGVRKVLGASVSNIASMLSKDFLKLVLMSTIIAFPIAWYAMHKWLMDFAFRISISWWVFVASAAAALTIAIVTVSFQSIKAALSNPVNSLRNE